MNRADSVRVAYPLFQTEGGGSTPTSALQLLLTKCSYQLFAKLNSLWHSRLPNPGGFYTQGMFFCAEYGGNYYAVAGWSRPVAIAFNGKPIYELRRFAIAPDAPPNTATRLLSLMVRAIKKEIPELEKFISYQDCDVHSGTIYKAQGWVPARMSKRGEQNWCKTHARPSQALQSDAPKQRWELALK
jgi:hypothetical protein